MKTFKILCAFIALSLSITTQAAFAKDKEFKFNFRGYVSEEINNQDDFALLKAAEYTLKKGYEYFVILETDRYDRTKKQRTTKFGTNSSKKPKLRTKLVIHCYDADPGVEGAYTANQIKQDIDAKYSE